MIGFKNTSTQMVAAEPQVHAALPSVEEMIRMKGLQEAEKVLLEYFNQRTFPALREQQRDGFFIARLRKIKERYFDEI